MRTGGTVRRFLILSSAVVVSAVVAYPVYPWFLRREAERRAASELAEFDGACALARLRLAGGGEFWSARIMANRCDARGR